MINWSGGRERTADGRASFYPAHFSEYFSGCVYQIILAFTFVVGKDYPFPYQKELERA